MANRRTMWIVPLVLLGLSFPEALRGQDEEDLGEVLFKDHCAECHSEAQSGRTPGRFSLSALTPRAIVAALDDGIMRREGSGLTDSQRIRVAEYLTNRSYGEDRVPETAFCTDAGPAPLQVEQVHWMGYGGGPAGTGFQTTDRAGLTMDDVPGLELRWAFAFPGATEVRTKPTVVGDIALVGDQFGTLYALETSSGCVRWTFEAESGIRGGIPVGRDAAGRAIAYVVDQRTTAYALDTQAGQVVWKTRVGWHPESNNTGHAVLHDGKLVIPISTMGEVVAAMNPAYECCTSSGAVAALDVETGDLTWYHRVIPEDPEEAGKNDLGTQLWAPSGAPVWSSPTIDAGRGLVYAGSGENLSRPASSTSDAVLAIDAETGELDWAFQATEGDAFTMACTTQRNRENCPAPPGPDVDFGMAPILVERPDGREVLVAGQKSGTVWALDPDDGGEVIWTTQIGKGGVLGGIHWGMATDGRLVYAANADRGAATADINPDMDWSPGLYALDLMTGEVVWSVPATTETCVGRRGCYAANSAAPTVIPGVVFAGGLDGHMRAHATDDGRVLWDVDTVREYETVNGVPGKGGAIDGPGPVVADGLVYVNSGYGTFGQMPGNVLLAFGPGGGADAQVSDLPRTAAGHPDMNGIWQAMGNAHWDIEPHSARPALAMQDGPVVPVPAQEVLALGAVGAVPSGYGVVVGGEIPYLPEAQAIRDENRAQWLERDPEIKCYLPGVPRANYMPFPFQIFQSDQRFVMSYEYAGAVRDVYLEHPGPPQVDSWMGQSVGQWEGDTFVVTVNGFNGRTWLDRAGNHHGSGLQVTERYTMTGPDHILYEAELEDPETFAEPWTIRMPLYRNVDPNARLGQFKCVEFVEELLYGQFRKAPIGGDR